MLKIRNVLFFINVLYLRYWVKCMNVKVRFAATEVIRLVAIELNPSRSLKMAGFVVNERLKYFSRELCREGTLNILLVSTSQSYLDTIAQSMYATREVQREKRSYNLKVHTCKSIVDVLQFMPREFYIDFIAFVLDSHIAGCLLEVENNLSWLDSSFTREKICLVSPDFSYPKALILPTEIWEFAKLHQFNLIIGRTMDQNSLFNLTKRILNLAEACCGILNGIPMISVV